MDADRAAVRARRRMYLHMVLRSVARRRSRVLIALLSVIIGATTLTGLITIYTDIPRQMGRQLRSSGANLVVQPSGHSSIPDSALPAIDRLIPADALVGRASYRYETVRINQQPYTAAGTDLNAVRTIRPYWQVTGTWPGLGQVLVGRDIATAIGLTASSPVKLTVAGPNGRDVATSFAVSGVLDTGGPEDSLLVLNRGDLDRLMGGPRGSDLVEYSVATGSGQLQTIAYQITASGQGLAASPVKRLERSETTVLNTLSSLLLLVTVVVLALIMITVATTTMAVVSERSAEIGLKKALGASNRSIRAEFLGEVLLQGALGGVAGGVLGLVFAQVVSLQVFGRGVGIQWWLIPAAAAASTLISAAACLIPIRRTTDIHPAVVLREE